MKWRGAREAVPQCGILQSRKRLERVIRNEQCEALQASSATIEDADIPYYVRRTLCLAEDTHVTEGQPYCHVLIKR